MRYRCVDSGSDAYNHDELILMEPTQEEIQHMLNLVEEIRNIVLDIPNLKSKDDKWKAAERMNEIKEEMKAFRRRYPNA